MLCISLRSSLLLSLLSYQVLAHPFERAASGPLKVRLTERSENGPVIAENFPDPSIVRIRTGWYAFATNSVENGEAINVPVASSPDFVTWTLLEGVDALPSPPAWVNMTSPNAWAPDVNELVCPVPGYHRNPPSLTNEQDDGTFVMYFSATVNNNYLHHCVGAATSRNIEGPYTPQPEPLFCPLDQGGAIDAAGFKDWSVKGNWSMPWGGGWRYGDRDHVVNHSAGDGYGASDDRSWTNPEWCQGGRGGQRYVTYKVDGNSIGHGDVPGAGHCGNTVAPIVPTPLVLQAVGADGVTLQGEPVVLLDNNGPADNGVVEAPSLVKNDDGTYVLFFSSNCFDSGLYNVNYATAPAITGPYTRHGPLFTSGDFGLVAPGGADVLWDARHMLFHADYPDVGTRALYTAIIDIEGNTVTA